MTPTKENKIDYQIIAPKDRNVKQVLSEDVLKPFDDISLKFISALSKRILENANLRQFPELISMAFWMRKSHIEKMKSEFESKKGEKIWIGRGIVYHIAPSNVDTIFIYSWFLSLLVGNINIIRISQNKNEQLDILIDIISEVCNNKSFAKIKKRFLILTYEHNDDITKYFSKNCDIRVIWGGDQTINKIRSIDIKPTATELSFADKFSIAVLNAKEVLNNKKDRKKLFENFYNDAFWFDQLACSSPKLICWLGDKNTIKKSKKIFWEGIKSIYQEKFDDFNATRSVDKMVAAFSLAIEKNNIEINREPKIQRIKLESYRSIDRDLHCGAGLFYELSISSMNDLNKFIIRKDQTIGVYGLKEKIIKEFIEQNLPKGIDRIVQVGKMMDFSNIWDGHDLLREFCREITIDL